MSDVHPDGLQLYHSDGQIRSRTCSRLSCIAGSAATNGAAGAAAGVHTPASAGFLSCSACATRWTERR